MCSDQISISVHQNLVNMALPQTKFFFISTLLLLSSFSVFANKDAAPLSPAPAPHSPVHSPSHAPIKGHHHHHLPPATAPTPPVKPPTHSLPPAAKPPTALPPKPHHHHNHSPSAQPPLHAKPPTHTHTPVTPPSASPPLQKKPISVRGLVYCKSCNSRGDDKLDNSSSPLMGAMVKLACNNTKYQLAEKSVTDKNGFFMITPKIVTSAGWHKCKVFLLSSPVLKCNVSTNFNLGIDGAPLNFTPPENKTLTHPLFTVGPFAFKPKKENC